ncbi:MAG: nuclear transport factor 2 family protein [Gammaproteobacteria bacterium]|nr:nuclear transport factor 2 family protein [Gammaproteobacteria bacterium]
MTATLSAADRLEVHELLARYAWSLDTGNEDDFVACFTREGILVWDVFDEPGCWQGHAALRRFATYFRGRPESAGRQHHVTNITLAATPEGVQARSYVLVALRVDAGPHRLHVMGHYEDVLRKQDEHWCIARRVIRDWSGPVLARMAGQDGQRRARQRPEALDGLWATQVTAQR